MDTPTGLKEEGLSSTALNWSLTWPHRQSVPVTHRGSGKDPRAPVVHQALPQTQELQRGTKQEMRKPGVMKLLLPS